MQFCQLFQIENFLHLKQGPHSKFELTGAKNWWLVANEDKVSKSSEKVHTGCVIKNGHPNSTKVDAFFVMVLMFCDSIGSKRT